MQIKITLGKLQVRKSPSQMVQFEVNRGALALLPISLGHIEELALLPSIHRDPFDRILIAQARCEKFIFITGDHIIRQYPIECLWE